MMDISKIKEKIDTALKVLLSDDSEVEMADSTLEDGATKVMAEAFEVGKVLYMIAEDGERVAAAEGTHVLESGEKIVVDAEGVITEILAAEGGDDASGGDDEEMEALKAKLSEITEERDGLLAKFNESETKLSEVLEASKAEKAKMEETLNSLKVELSAAFEGSQMTPNPQGKGKEVESGGLEDSTLDRVASFLK